MCVCVCVCICWYKYIINNKNAQNLHKNKNKKCTHEIKLRFATAKAGFNNKNSLYVQQPRLKFKEQTIKCYIWSTIFVVLKFAQFEK